MKSVNFTLEHKELLNIRLGFDRVGDCGDLEDYWTYASAKLRSLRISIDEISFFQKSKRDKK